MKRRTPIQEIECYRNGITDSIRQWTDLNAHGCNDPCWNDGYNMNLLRNHVLYYRKKMEQLCDEQHLTLPIEYYLPVPPVVPNSYMANKDQKERIRRLESQHRTITFDKPIYDNTQLCF